MIAEKNQFPHRVAKDCVAKLQEYSDNFSNLKSTSEDKFKEAVHSIYMDCFRTIDDSLTDFLERIAKTFNYGFVTVLEAITEGKYVPSPLNCIIDKLRDSLNLYESAFKAIERKATEVKLK